MHSNDDIAAIPLKRAVPPVGHCWAVQRVRDGHAPMYLTKHAEQLHMDLRRPLWVKAQGDAHQYGDLRLAGIAAGWLIQYGGVPQQEVSCVAIPTHPINPARERLLNRTAARKPLPVQHTEGVDEMPRKSLVRRAMEQVDRDQRRKQAGFAMLLEVLVLCAIMVVIAAAVAPNIVKAARAQSYRAARLHAQDVWNLEQASTTCHAQQQQTPSTNCTPIDIMLPPVGTALGAGNYVWTYTPPDTNGAWMYVGVPDKPDPVLPQIAIGPNGQMYCGNAACSVGF